MVMERSWIHARLEPQTTWNGEISLAKLATVRLLPQATTLNVGSTNGYKRAFDSIVSLAVADTITRGLYGVFATGSVSENRSILGGLLIAGDE